MYIRSQQLRQQPGFSDPELIQRWVNLLAPHQRQFHWESAKQFQNFVDKPLAQVTRADLEAFATSLGGGVIPISSVPTLAAVKSLLMFGHRTGFLPDEVVPHRQPTPTLDPINNQNLSFPPSPKIIEGNKRNKIFPVSFNFYLLPLTFFRFGWGFALGICCCGLGLISGQLVKSVLVNRPPQSSIATDSSAIAPLVGQEDSAYQKKASYLSANTKAFLDTLAWAEGTAGRDGYRTQFTGSRFSSFNDHPRSVRCSAYTGERRCSSAAGRYQFLEPTWDRMATKLRLKDFSPRSQDIAAVELIREYDALADVEAGNFEKAIAKISDVWASLPGAPYNQPKKSMSELKKFYQGRLREYQTSINLSTNG